ncbi:MAG: P-loop NTPase fold protein [Verrucomicrobiota bacterium]
MWNDIETTNDLLNFSVLATIAAKIIRDSDNEPLSIGVSGSWGTGKSSLVKMIEKELKNGEQEGQSEFVFTTFNAWLYQGYDDARMALLNSIGDLLLKEATERETAVDKVVSFIQKINWLRLGKQATPIIGASVAGGLVAGPLGALIGAAGAIAKNGFNNAEDLAKLKESYSAIAPAFEGVGNPSGSKSLPKEIDELRKCFAEILDDLKIKLVVLVDDLDRCLPNTAISTLEAMRLMLFMPRTSFIIAADEEMIRHAVRNHFDGLEIGDQLVTSYFDKLIQVPLKVPRLGINEVKGYLILLFADYLMREGDLTHEKHVAAKKLILNAVNQSWKGALTSKVMKEAFGDSGEIIKDYITLADEVAQIMTTSDRIAGNPRLIKRFLNDLSIRQSMAESQGMTLQYDALVKMLLLERCASPSVLDTFTTEVSKSSDGKLEWLEEAESFLADGKDDALSKIPDTLQKSDFYKDWLRISPKLGTIDLRPILYLGQNQVNQLVGYDSLSQEAREILQALLNSTRINPALVRKLKEIGETEASIIQKRITSKARSEQYSLESIKRALNMPTAFESLRPGFVELLGNIPPKSVKTSMVAFLKNEDWCHSIFKTWLQIEAVDNRVKTAIEEK